MAGYPDARACLGPCRGEEPSRYALAFVKDLTCGFANSVHCQFPDSILASCIHLECLQAT